MTEPKIPCEICGEIDPKTKWTDYGEDFLWAGEWKTCPLCKHIKLYTSLCYWDRETSKLIPVNPLPLWIQDLIMARSIEYDIPIIVESSQGVK